MINYTKSGFWRINLKNFENIFGAADIDQLFPECPPLSSGHSLHRLDPHTWGAAVKHWGDALFRHDGRKDRIQEEDMRRGEVNRTRNKI